MNTKINSNKIHLALTALLLAACQPSASTAVSPIESQSTSQPTALTPATLAPTPTQFQPELTSQATDQATNQASFGIKQMAGALAIQPTHYEWTQQVGSTQVPEGYVLFSIQVSLVNTSPTDSINFDPSQFALLDSQGKALTLSNTNAQGFMAQTLSPGKQVQGSLFYEVPETAQTETGWGLNLVFNGLDNLKLSWSLAG